MFRHGSFPSGSRDGALEFSSIPGALISAATTTDGGCLVMVDRVFPPQRRAVLTLRVDWYPALSGHSAVAGERLEVSGKYGTYILQIFGLEGILTQLAVWLRSHHAGAGVF